MIGGAKGIGIGLDFGIGNIKRPTKRDTLDPAIKEALCGVWIADQNTNESPTRNIIKNKLKDRGGDFEILNAAYKGNSGYGKYEEDFNKWAKYPNVITNDSTISTNSDFKLDWLVYKRASDNSIKGMKIRVSGIPKNGILKYIYAKQYDSIRETELFITEDGIYKLPESKLVTTSFSVGFKLSNNDWTNITIEQVPDYQGAFCTDGVDDMIVSQKSVSEMLGGSNEITVVSMITNLDSRQILCNSIFSNVATYNVRNLLEANNVTTILGYTDKDGTITNLNLIMGDKNSIGLTDKVNFNSIYDFYPTGYLSYYYKVAWYWTFIAKRVLTTDEINQVIAYYNLDKYVAPDIYYDIKKQGLTNENHAEFGDKLIDYSGNGKDMQLYNFGWKGNSGIGKYNFSNINVLPNRFEGTVTTNKCHFTKKLTNTTNNFCDLIVISPNEPIKFKVSGLSDGRKLFIANRSGSGSNYSFDNGEHEVSLSFGEEVTQNNPFGVTGDTGNIDVTVEFIPSYADALVFDGVDDYGQYVGDLGLKDYTVVADRAYVGLISPSTPIASAISSTTNCPFLFEHFSTSLFLFSYNLANNLYRLNENKFISYQSTYVYNGNTINKGTSINTGDGLTFGRYGGNTQYAALCLYNFMLFPYSLSEFLIERQLKKRKLGTLHPVVKFNPIIEGNEPFEILKYHKITADNAYLDVTKGEYIPIGHEIGIDIKLSDNTFKLTKVTSSSLTDINFGMPPGTPYATIIGTLTDKSPQDIEIYIENNQQGGGGEPVIDFTTWIKGNAATMTCTPTTIHLTNMTAAGMVIETKSIDLVLPSIKVRVSGVQKGRGVAFQYNKPDGTFNLYWCETDGEHTIPSSVHTEKQQYTIIKTNFAGDCDILVEVLT